MRNWLFHPLIFYPLAIILAGLVIGVSLRPQAWPREPAPVAAQAAGMASDYTGAAFSTPSPDPQQNMTVVRDTWGNATALRIAVLPSLPAPTPSDHGVRLLVTPEDSARLSNHPVSVEITYNALPLNASSVLAVSLQGDGPVTWASQPTPPDGNSVRIDLPAQSAVNAIGLRAVHLNTDEAFGIEITRIRVIPRT